MNTILLPAIYEGSRDLRDKTKKLSFQTNEVTPQQAADLQLCVQQFVYLAVKLEPFTKEQMDIVNNLKSDFDDFQKSHAQRLRAVLFRLWEQQNEGYKDFNLYYAFKMEGFINHLKSKLL
jgi:hypothetical protein